MRLLTFLPEALLLACAASIGAAAAALPPSAGRGSSLSADFPPETRQRAKIGRPNARRSYSTSSRSHLRKAEEEAAGETRTLQTNSFAHECPSPDKKGVKFEVKIKKRTVVRSCKWLKKKNLKRRERICATNVEAVRTCPMTCRACLKGVAKKCRAGGECESDECGKIFKDKRGKTIKKTPSVCLPKGPFDPETAFDDGLFNLACVKRVFRNAMDLIDADATLEELEGKEVGGSMCDTLKSAAERRDVLPNIFTNIRKCILDVKLPITTYFGFTEEASVIKKTVVSVGVARDPDGDYGCFVTSCDGYGLSVSASAGFIMGIATASDISQLKGETWGFDIDFSAVKGGGLSFQWAAEMFVIELSITLGLAANVFTGMACDTTLVDDGAIDPDCPSGCAGCCAMLKECESKCEGGNPIRYTMCIENCSYDPAYIQCMNLCSP